MSNKYSDFVFSLSDTDFELLQSAVSLRKNHERCGVTDFEELAIKYGRIPSCPECGNNDYVSFGSSQQGKIRFRCNVCGKHFNLISNTIFHYANKSFDTWCTYLVLMSFNVPLEMCEGIIKGYF